MCRSHARMPPTIGLALLLSLAANSLAASPSTAPADSSHAAAHDLAPTLVTLQYTDAPATLVLDDLFRQTRLPYRTNPANQASAWPNITIHLDNRPYWEAVAALEDSSGLSINTGYSIGTDHLLDPNSGIITVARNSPTAALSAGPRCISGPIMFVAQSISHSADFTDPAGVDHCSLAVRARFEPGLHIGGYMATAQADMAIDPLGNSILQNIPAPPSTITLPGIVQTIFQVQFLPTASAGHTIADLKGSFHVQLAGDAKTLVIPAKDFNQYNTIQFNGLTCTIDPIAHALDKTHLADDPTAYEIRFTLDRGTLNDPDWTQARNLLSAATVELRDANDAVVSTTTDDGSTESRTDRALHKICHFTAAPAKCVLTFLTSFRDVPVPFEFKNIPLP